MDDTISRQAAILAIEEYADRLQMVNWKENPGVPYKAYALNWAINTLRDLPSAERWTPVTDELPEIGDRALVTIPSIGETFVTIGTYAGEYRWHISNYGFCEKVIAWMPLPEPYAERRTDE